MGRRIWPFVLTGWLVITTACVGVESTEKVDIPDTVVESISPTSVPVDTPDAAVDSATATSVPDDGPFFSTSGWKTDFTKHSVPYTDIASGGPPKDGIPPVDKPKFLEASSEIDWLQGNEPVVALSLAGEAKAYPIQILIWHEIVNDTFGDIPVSVTFCPLCNTAIAFDRRIDGTTYDFGTTGKLRYSDLIMYDRQTESWWQQITGEAIVGELTGTLLKTLPAAIISYNDFRAAYPQGKVLSRDTGNPRFYGDNPYTGYDDINSSPFLFRGPSDGRLPPMTRVVTVSLDGEDSAYPFEVLQEHKVIQHQVGNTPLVIFWASGTASALDKEAIAESRDIGATAVYKATVDGTPLTFDPLPDGTFRDKETGTEWNLLGQAISGALTGKTLEPVVHANHFWFAWAVFKPQTTVFQAKG